MVFVLFVVPLRVVFFILCIYFIVLIEFICLVYFVLYIWVNLTFLAIWNVWFFLVDITKWNIGIISTYNKIVTYFICTPMDMVSFSYRTVWCYLLIKHIAIRISFYNYCSNEVNPILWYFASNQHNHQLMALLIINHCLISLFGYSQYSQSYHYYHNCSFFTIELI